MTDIYTPSPTHFDKFIKIGETDDGTSDMLICGYCETNQDADNPYCQSCGGPLNDDIANRRNGLNNEPAKLGITTQEAADALSLLARI